LAQAGEKSIAF